MNKLRCPKPSCGSFHVIRNGLSQEVRCLQDRKRQRFRCQECGTRFSENYFHLSYRLKKADLALNFKIFKLFMNGLTCRGIARSEMVSDHCVRIRLHRMAQKAFVFQSSILKDFKIKEAICMDGLENFAGSQYDPNNINQAIGRDSLFIYDFNFSSLNRKGRKSAWQKRRLAEIEQAYGRYNPKSIQIGAKTLFKRLFANYCSDHAMHLLTDEHFQYRKALADLHKEAKRVCDRNTQRFFCQHVTISSKACRNFQNILFSVNHVDLMIRQNLGVFKRETISFSKTPGAMTQKYALYMVYKNFMCPQFTKKHLRRPHAHTRSPAEHLGLTDHTLAFHEIFHQRSLPRDADTLNHEWRYFFHAQIPPEHRRTKKFSKIKESRLN